MPIAVFLEDIHGTNRRGTVADGYGGLNRCLPIGDESFPLLRYVDPYGNVVFNHLQMQQLLEEINSLISGCSDQESKDLLETSGSWPKNAGVRTISILDFEGIRSRRGRAGAVRVLSHRGTEERRNGKRDPSIAPRAAATRGKARTRSSARDDMAAERLAHPRRCHSDRRLGWPLANFFANSRSASVSTRAASRKAHRPFVTLGKQECLCH